MEGGQEEPISKPEEASGSEDDSDEVPFVQEEIDQQFLAAVRDNKTEEVKAMLADTKKPPSPNYEKDGWSAILLASCNGNESIVRELIKKEQVLAPYKKASKQAQNQDNQNNQIQKSDNQNDDEDFDPFVKPKDASKVGKYTPLHWASYKGHYKVVWILLAAELSPLDIDQYGNTAVHQAAASGNIDVLTCFLSKGVDIDVKNARGHTPLDLCTDKTAHALIKKATSTKKCQGKGCTEKFDFKNIRYYCQQSKKFYCIKHSVQDLVYENWQSEIKERPVCRSKEVATQIEQHEQELQAAINSNDFFQLDKALQSCRDIDIAVKQKNQAELLHAKLQHELKIKNFLREKDHHDNYKEIRKDFQIVSDMMQEAIDKNIELDSQLIAEINNFQFRLQSERNLRKQRDLYIESIASCDQKKVEKLQKLIDIAQEFKVEPQYIESAAKLTEQMKGNLQAKETLQMLLDYEEREYPEPEEVDPKKKKDPKAAPPKKKKKKGDTFPIPAWATELDDVVKKVKEMEQLASEKIRFMLDDEFIGKVQYQLQRFKKEISYRRQLEEEARLEAELKALKKKKKK